MKLSLLILAAPYHAAGSLTALRYCETALDSGHQIHRLFFYGEGVHNATLLAAPPQDELDIPAAWRALIQTHQLDAIVCIAAALRRGIINPGESRRYEKPASNLDPEFQLGGLGLLAEAANDSDRVISFGA